MAETQGEPPLDLLPAQTAARRGFWQRLKRGLTMTHTELIERLGAAVGGRGFLEADTLEALEEALIGADLGVETSFELITRLRERVARGEARDLGRLRALLADEITELLRAVPPAPPPVPPHVTLVVGVNGVGKTTSIAKLARRSLDLGESVLIAAADTFRAAAPEQLLVWGERLGVPVVRQHDGADPAAVVFDALAAARPRRNGHVLVDTAGRLHTKSNQMQELAKIGRVLDREGAGLARRTVLVLDATTGQNAIAQAREFSQVVPIDGLFLTKLDGTAKGGVVVAITRALQRPVLYLGVGEQAEDLVDFEPREFAAAMCE